MRHGLTGSSRHKHVSRTDKSQGQGPTPTRREVGQAAGCTATCSPSLMQTSVQDAFSPVAKRQMHFIVERFVLGVSPGAFLVPGSAFPSSLVPVFRVFPPCAGCFPPCLPVFRRRQTNNWPLTRVCPCGSFFQAFPQYAHWHGIGWVIACIVPPSSPEGPSVVTYLQLGRSLKSCSSYGGSHLPQGWRVSFCWWALVFLKYMVEYGYWRVLLPRVWSFLNYIFTDASAFVSAPDLRAGVEGNGHGG